MTQATGATQRLKVSVKGIVQGVGFRPFVYQLALKHNLKGWVVNTSGSVEIEVEGGKARLDNFLAELKDNQPPQARINSLTSVTDKPVGFKGFEIRESLLKAGQYQLISPDLATCPECLQDFSETGNRRYRYPFTNCTNCGPRFTIIADIPYDRPLTTMKAFKMCPACQKEYEDPMNRRFHAQPNACPVCGPSLELVDNNGQNIATDDAITTTARLLKEGKILAIRGLGGFLLACDATNDDAIATLRQRKRRPGKPLAVMMSSLDEAQKHCEISAEEAKLLASPPAPIVLIGWKAESSIAKLTAPNNKYLGIMLPYTPLHHLLMKDTARPLVMTSGNLSEEPIAKDNDEALERLSKIADYFLWHNRDIHSRYDDSVTMFAAGEERLVRKARGYAPSPIHLPFKARQVLACGAEEKNTFCLTRDDNAFLSQHIGDMENVETLEHFEATIALYEKMFRLKPELIACDLHPDYLSAKWGLAKAEAEKLPIKMIQHHHAHIASCMAENGVSEPVIGVSFDGTGYGTDGHIWGGEFMIADYKGFTRRGHLEYLPLPGGAAAIKKPYRTTIGYLYQLFGQEGLDNARTFVQGVNKEETALIIQQVDKGLNSPLTSSCGRLFDAVSALIGVCGQTNYDAQAAIELEMIAANDIEKTYPFTIEPEGEMKIIRLEKLFTAIISDMKSGTAASIISAKFHNTISQMTTLMCRQLAKECGLKTVAISGGCFQNRRLMGQTITGLKAAGFNVISQSQVPANDGGVALGQAVIAARDI